MTLSSGIIVDTQGWDLVVGIPLAMANGALAQAASSLPSTFSYSGTSGTQSYTLSGQFGPWSFVGGSSQDVQLSLPIVSGTLSVTGQGLLPAGTQQLAGAVVPISTRLAFSPPSPNDGSVNLQFAFTEGQSPPPQSGSPMANGNLAGDAQLDPVATALLPIAIASCLAADRDKLGFAFATLIPQFSSDLPDVPVSTPQLEYLIAGQAGGTLSLVILYAAGGGAGVTGAGLPGSAQELQPCVPTALVMTDGQVTVALSQAVVLSQVIRPALAEGLEKAQYPFPGRSGGMGFGPQLPRSAGTTTDVDPNSFQPSVTGPGSGQVSGQAPVTLNLLGYTQSMSLILSNITLTVNGGAGTLAYSATSPQFLGVAANVVQAFTSSVGPSRFDGLIAGGLTLSVDQTPILQPSQDTSLIGELLYQHVAGAVSARLPGSLSAAFNSMPAPMNVTLFGGQMVDPHNGYWNGGIVFSGPLVASSAA